MTADNVLLVFLICLVCGFCILLLIEPLRRRCRRRVEYDVQEENPWKDLLHAEGDGPRGMEKNENENERG